MSNEKLPPCPLIGCSGTPYIDGTGLVYCSNSRCLFATTGVAPHTWEKFFRPSADAQGLAEEIDQVAWQNNPGKRMTVTVPASWLTKIRGQVASLASPPSEPPADLESWPSVSEDDLKSICKAATVIYGDDRLFTSATFSSAFNDRYKRKGVLDGGIVRAMLTGRTWVWQDPRDNGYWKLRSYRPEPAGGRSDAVGEVEQELRRAGGRKNDVMGLPSETLLGWADKLAGSATTEPHPDGMQIDEAQSLRDTIASLEADKLRLTEIIEEMEESIRKRPATPEPHPPTVPEITPEVAEQLRHESDECSAAMAERIRRLQPQPATIPSPSVAAVLNEIGRALEQIDHLSRQALADALRAWISQLRAATAGTGEVVVAVSPDIGSAIAATTWDEASERALSEWGDHALIHRVPVHGAPQPEKDGAECGALAPRIMAKALKEAVAERDKALAYIATEREARKREDKACSECLEAHEAKRLALQKKLDEGCVYCDGEGWISDRDGGDLCNCCCGKLRKELHAEQDKCIKALVAERDSERARAEKAEQAQEGHMVEAGRLRAQMEELETQLADTRHRASEAEARAAHEIRIAKHQGEQRIKAEKRVGELEKQLEAVGDAAVRSLVQLAEKHSQNEPCAVSCEYFHCDSLLPRCGKTGKTFPTIDNCPSPPNQCEECDRHQLTIDGPGPCTDRHNCAALRGKPPRPSTESGEKPCLTCENLNQSEGVCKLDPNRFGSCVRYMDWKANKAKQSGEGNPCETCESRQYREVQSELRCTEWRSCPEYRNNKEKTMIDANLIGKIGTNNPTTEQVDSAAQSGRAGREGMELVGERLGEGALSECIFCDDTGSEAGSSSCGHCGKVAAPQST